MRILVDINHPAHVHLFKNLIWLLQRRGHHVRVTARQKDVTCDLLDALGIKYVCLSRIGSGLVALGKELLTRYARLFALKLAILRLRIGLLVFKSLRRVTHTSRDSKSILGSMNMYMRSPMRLSTSPRRLKKKSVANTTG